MHIRRMAYARPVTASDTSFDYTTILGVILGVLLGGGVIGTIYQYFVAAGSSFKT